MVERFGQNASTINDVASLAGVSIKTVSRVMNEEPNVREDTRLKVKDAARLLNYRPNLLARSLAGARSYLIGLLYDNPIPAYINDLQTGIIKRCRESGYHLLCEPQEAQSPDVGRSVAEFLATIRVDGVILSPPLCEMPAVLQAVEAAGVPYVRISPHIFPNRAASVKMDEQQAAYDMTSYLIEKGHRDIGFIKGPDVHGGSHQRYNGFAAAMIHHGLSPNADWVGQGEFTFESGRAAAKSILLKGKKPTAIFAANDHMAFGVMAELQDLGLKVPDDISVVGFDDTPGCQLVWPHLTTIKQPVQSMAYRAADLLLKGAFGELEKSLSHHEDYLDYGLIERASVKEQ